LLLSTSRGWVRVLERIAADLDNLSLVPNDPHADSRYNSLCSAFGTYSVS
jgi:hypothetical protein